MPVRESKRAEYLREWRKNNPDKLAVINLRYRETNRERLRQRSKSGRRLKWGITLEQWHGYLDARGRECELCKRVLDENSDSRKDIPVLDHCHITGKWRGILCHICNLKLAIVEDAQFVRIAQGYLNKYSDSNAA
jgi:hypothetical protein